MPTGTATVTASTGPGRAVTAKVISNVKSFFVDIERQMLFFYLINSDPTSPALEYALSNTVTFTATISGGTWTITVVVA
jgi:hypothetical protein